MTDSNHERILSRITANRETIELDAVAGNREEKWNGREKNGEGKKHRDKGQDQSTKDRLSSAIIHPQADRMCTKEVRRQKRARKRK